MRRSVDTVRKELHSQLSASMGLSSAKYGFYSLQLEKTRSLQKAVYLVFLNPVPKSAFHV